jgi:hypothetical protein
MRIIHWGAIAAVAVGILGARVPGLLPTPDVGSEVSGWVTGAYGWVGWSTVAFYIALAGVLAYARLSSGSSPSNWDRIFFLVASIGVLLSLVRIAIAAYAIALAIIAWKSRHRVRTISVLVVVLVGVFFFSPVKNRTFYDPSSVSLSEFSPQDLPKVLNTQGRDTYWRVALHHFDDNPAARIWGAGLGITPSLLKSQLGYDVSLHSDWLRIYLELGLVGLAMMIFFLIHCARQSSRTLGLSSSMDLRAVSLSGVAASLFFAIASLTDNTLDYYAPVLSVCWMIWGLTASAFSSKTRETSP